MFTTKAEYDALEDTLYHLDRALAQDAIDLPTFLKHVRNLARKQFLSLSLMQRIVKQQKK